MCRCICSIVGDVVVSNVIGYIHEFLIDGIGCC